tara:strand:+ start:3070 stop:3270 length:201 start_codon:yes stop_codon:yes gene_type:complete
MENEMRDDMLDEVKPLKKYQFDVVCRFEVEAETKPDSIIIAIERLEGIQITNVQELKCQEIVKNDG